MRTRRAPILALLTSLALALLVGPAGPTGDGAAAARADHPVQPVHADHCLIGASGARLGLLPADRADGASPAVGDALGDRQRRRLEREIDRRLALLAQPSAGTSRSALMPLDSALDSGLGSALGQAGSTSDRGDVTVRVPVHAHVVDGTRDGDEAGPGRRRVERQLDVLNRAFAGDQSGASPAAPFRFHLASLERVVHDRWHRAAPDSRAERRMKKSLTVGGLDELNLFFAEPRVRGGSIALGSASFPWEAERTPAADGVVVHTASMPGGDARGYGRGDSAVHEVGHWLGLFHTFEGGCGGNGDMVDDTPSEGAPSFGCSKGQDSCPSAKGNDPVHNFMNYSPDRCMDRFTPDQVDRMSRVWLAYRAQ